MARAKLTALAVDRAHRAGAPVLLSDGDGLYLRKQNRESASWTLRYTFAGRPHWLTLGNYPDMPLAQARIEARQARVLLDKQQDPLSVRRAALAEERQKGSFKSLCEDWYRAEVQARGLKHPAVPRRYLDKYLLPKLGRFAASDITPADVAQLLDDLKGRSPTAANDLLRFTRRIFAFGVRRRFLMSNPARPAAASQGTNPFKPIRVDVEKRAGVAIAVSVRPAGSQRHCEFPDSGERTPLRSTGLRRADRRASPMPSNAAGR